MSRGYRAVRDATAPRKPSIYEQVTNKLSVHFADIGEPQVKNIPTHIHVYMVAATAG